MKLIWTKNNLPLSLLIRAVTGEESSHFAMVFQSAAKGLMFQSNLIGTHPKFFYSAKKTFTVVHELDLPLTPEQENELWDIVIQEYDGRGYDFLGALYTGFFVLRERIFKIPRPAINKWGDPKRFYCNEVYEALNRVKGFESLPPASGMETPEDVWAKLEKWRLA